jgi:steroid delta-isomerase-like uncharacterized protein
VSEDPDAKAVVLRWVAGINARDLDAVADTIAVDFENHQLPLGVIVGRDAYMRHLGRWFEAYPDLHVDVVTCFAVDGTVCAELVEHGVRQGDFNGQPPSGAHETFFGVDVFEVRDGRLAIQRGYWDYSVGTGLPAPKAGGHGPDDSRYFQPRTGA